MARSTRAGCRATARGCSRVSAGGCRLGALALAAWALVACAQPPVDLEIHAGLLIDGNGGEPREDVVVRIRDGRIESIRPGREAGRVAAIRAIEVPDKVLIPGLFDMHGHVTMTQRKSTGSAAAFQATVQYRREVAEWMLRRLLHYGVTTVRETGDFLEEGVALKRDLAAGQIPGPRLFACGPLIEADPPLFASMSVVVRGEEEARAEVRRQVEAGVDFLKIYASLPPALSRAVIQEAHARGRRVLGHLEATSWTEAVELGIDGIVHALPAPRDILEDGPLARLPKGGRFWEQWLATQTLFDPSGSRARSLFSTLKNKRIVNDPNLVVFRNTLASEGFLRSEQRAEMAQVPSFLREGWEQEAKANSLGRPADAERARELVRLLQRFVKSMHDAGVPLLAGSDLANPNVLPGLSLHQELQLLAEAGIPPMQVLVMATRDAADWLGILAEVGTLEPGKRADLLILDRNPIEDIRHTRSIWRVVQSGREVDRRALARD